MTQGSLSEEALRQIRLFRRQYLQLLDAQNLAWPSSETLRSSQAQEWIYEHLFQTDDVSHFLPPERYRLLILKPLMSKIENSIVDPEEDVSVFWSLSYLPCFLMLCLFYVIRKYQTTSCPPWLNSCFPPFRMMLLPLNRGTG